MARRKMERNPTDTNNHRVAITLPLPAWAQAALPSQTDPGGQVKNMLTCLFYTIDAGIISPAPSETKARPLPATFVPGVRLLFSFVKRSAQVEAGAAVGW